MSGGAHSLALVKIKIILGGKAILEPLYVLSENSFVKLKHLMLEDAYICTVEPICRMDAPILDNLNLGMTGVIQAQIE